MLAMNDQSLLVICPSSLLLAIGPIHPPATTMTDILSKVKTQSTRAAYPSTAQRGYVPVHSNPTGGLPTVGDPGAMAEEQQLRFQQEADPIKQHFDNIQRQMQQFGDLHENSKIAPSPAAGVQLKRQMEVSCKLDDWACTHRVLKSLRLRLWMSTVHGLMHSE